ncbi:GNAT family N-acetyltransferase [Rhizobium herbae]|uniref:GNAT family N-acetyltransferase n=1 Tax=Rhizobium herbae TaxID=508661 RepID=A0ABS7H3I1_9HYPH|nr:GNAT family N-acetyltransferase [Rhizobium herbae]
MSAVLVLRAAQRKDAAELAVLVDIASHGFATWLWYGAVMRGDKDSAMEQGRSRMRNDHEPGTWKDAMVAEWDGEIAGVSIGYDLEESVRDMVAPHPVIKPLLDLQVTVIGSRFIDSLGVYRHHRRKGIGRALLAREIEKAKGRQVSLITESHNETAQALYFASGFVEKARLPAVPLFENSKRHDWVLLARDMT